jgi:hypothetical protein
MDHGLFCATGCGANGISVARPALPFGRASLTLAGGTLVGSARDTRKTVSASGFFTLYAELGIRLPIVQGF